MKTLHADDFVEGLSGFAEIMSGARMRFDIDMLREPPENPATGTIVFNTTTNRKEFYDGKNWRATDENNSTRYIPGRMPGVRLEV